MLSLFSREGLLSLLISIPGLLIAISMHECAHGYMAYFMGDSTVVKVVLFCSLQWPHSTLSYK